MGIMEVFTRPEQHPLTRILGGVVRYRAELTLTTCVVVAALYLRGWVGPDWSTGILVAATVIVFVVPVSRRWVTRRLWCVYARHRARTCMVQTRTMTHDGRMPFLYWSRPSPVGERIRVWLPAGLEVKDLEGVCPELAVACWARTARIEANRRFAHLVVIEIVRRDPLGTTDLITPAVLHGLPARDEPATGPGEEHPEGDAVVVPLPARSTLPAPARDEPTPTTTGTSAARASRRNPPGQSRTQEREDGPAVTGFGGVDVSDYV
ncbi:MAG: hypothetical protein AB7V44_28310 [Pseudonocardia sp.]